MKTNRQCGFTLIELLISITLVAALSAGILSAMRAGLLTMQKTNDRITSNRRVLSVQQILQHQISNAMPVTGQCGFGAAAVPVFSGDPETLVLVSSYSMTEGARGYPRVLVYQVVPSDRGVRLVVDEALYSGPASTAPFCAGGHPVRPPPGPATFVLADRLAYCRFVYKSMDPESPRGGGWILNWNQAVLPFAVRVEMAPLAGDAANLPLMTVTARIAVTRDPETNNNDYW